MHSRAMTDAGAARLSNALESESERRESERCARARSNISSHLTNETQPVSRSCLGLYASIALACEVRLSASCGRDRGRVAVIPPLQRTPPTTHSRGLSLARTPPAPPLARSPPPPDIPLGRAVPPSGYPTLQRRESKEQRPRCLRERIYLSPLPLEQQHRTNETKKSIESNKKDRKNRCVPRSIAQIARSTATLRVSVSFLLRRLCCFFCCCCWLVASSRSLARSFGSRLVVAFALIAAVPRRYLAGDRTLVARRCSAVISLARLESLFAKGV